MPVLFLSSDLVFSSRLAGAGQRLGVPVSSVSSLDAAVARVQGDSVGLVILDLSALNVDPQTAVSRLRESQPALAIVGYAPHVHEDRLRAAAEAGCKEVLTRGQFDRQMEQILNRYCGGTESVSPGRQAGV
jgi:CheY-like chemotaxis protein